MAQQDFCDITVVLDRSGSMESLKKEIEGGFDSWIAGQRKLPGRCNVTLVQFDLEATDIVYSARPVSEVPPLDLQPRGMTPLLDAVGTAITKTGERLKGMSEDERPGKVLFVILTDGQENSSREWTLARVKDAITRQRDTYKWEFIFLGLGIDAFTDAQALGIPKQFTSSKDYSPQGASATFRVAGNVATSYRKSGNATIDPDA